MFTANGKRQKGPREHVSPKFATRCFLVKLSSFELASKTGIILQCSHLCTHFFKKTLTQISRLPFAVNAILNLRDGTVVRALASNQCGPGSIPGLGVICGLSLSLVLVLAPRVFLRVLRFSSLHKNQHFQIPIRPGTHGHL